MSDKKSRKITSRARKVLRRVLLALAFVAALCAAAALAIPVALSSGWLREVLLEQASKATGKPARLRSLSFRWADGLRLEELQIGQGGLEDPGFLVRIGTLHADFSLPAALRGDARLSLELDGLRLRVPPKGAAEPEAPQPLPLPEALRGLFESLRTGLNPTALKLDAHLRVALSDMAVRLDTLPDAKVLELRNMALDFNVPGLKTGPATLHAAFDLYADAVRMAPVRLDARIEGLADGNGRLAPALARLTAKLTAPGLDLSTSGSLAKTLKCDLRLDLSEAIDAVRPLAASPLPELDGSLSLDLTLSQPAQDRIAAGVVLHTTGLRATGGPLGDKSFGPLDFNLLQEAELDLKAETARLPGSLNLKPSSQVRWLGELTGVADGAPRATLSVKPVHVAFAELLPALRAFLPQGLSLGSATMDAQAVDLSVLLARKPASRHHIEARATGLLMTAKDIARRDVSGTMSLGSALLRLDSAAVSLPGDAPGQLEANLNASLDALRLANAQDGAKTALSVRLLSLPHVSVRMEALRLNPAALFGISGKAVLELEALAKDIGAKGKAAIPALNGQTRLRAELPPAKSASLNLEALDLSAPLLRVLQPGKRPVEAPLTLHAHAPDIRLSGPMPLAPTVEGMTLTLDLGQALRCAATGSLTGSGGRDLRTAGQLSLDARKLLALAAPFVPRQAKAAGGLSLDWKLAATLPPAQAEAPLASAKPGKAPALPAKKLSQTIRGLNFVHEAEAVLKLGDLSLDWPLAPQPGQPAAAEILRLRGLTTPRPLRLFTREGARESSLTGSLAFGPMDALPGLGRLTKPLRGLMTVNAAQQNVRSVQFSEVLHLDGLELDQNLSLVLDRLDTVLDRDADLLAAALEKMDATASFQLVSGLQGLPQNVSARNGGRGIAGKGRLEAGAEVRLTGGKSLILSARLLSPGLDLTFGPDTAITGLTSDVRLSRRFALSPGLRCPGETESESAPLSELVFEPFPAISAPQPGRGAEALGQLLRTDMAAPAGGVFGLARLKMKSGGLPLDIRDVQARLDTSGPVPGLRSFRAGLLGGNVLGSAMIRKNAGHYTLDADMAFTGIDPARLLPAKAPKDLGSQAETAGRVSITMPLTADSEELLQRLNFRADITKIGPRTLERMLYALDPDELNETIVQQRRLMGIGYPRFLRVAAAYGNLSLSGAVDVKGFQLDLPQVDRLSIANLPLRRQLAKPLASVPALIKALDAASGSQICRNPADAKGTLRVVQPATTQGVPQ